MTRSRVLLALSCVAGLAYSLQVYASSPALVPLHFGRGGVPDRWGPPNELLAVHLGLIVFGTALFVALPVLFRRVPPSMVNLPDKDYWLSPAHRDQAAQRLAVWADSVGISVNLLVIVLQLVLPSAPAVRSPSPLPLLVVAAFVLFSLGSCIWLVRALRRPSSEQLG